MYRLRTRQFVPSELDTVFAFFAEPENLARITPDSLAFEILTPSPVPMREGALIDYSLGLGRIRLRWRTLITSYDPPRLFVDEQLAGPYSFWHHTHEFEAVEGGVLIKDTVLYLPPFGPVGDLAHALFIKGRLRKIFAHRGRVIRERFGHGSDPVEPPVFDRV